MAGTHCEMCGDALPDSHLQHLVTISVRSNLGAPDSNEDPADRDHLMELHELLEQTMSLSTDGDDDLLEDTEICFSLCDECRTRFCDDPLQRDSLTQLAISDIGFTDN